MLGQVEVAEARVVALLARCRTPWEKANVYAMQLRQLTVCNRMGEAVAAGLEGLRLLGIHMKARPSTLTIAGELLLAKTALGNRRIADLENAPVIEDPTVILSMRILIDFIPPAYLTGNDKLFAAAVLKQVRLSLKHGVSAESAAAYASYVVLLAGLGNLSSAEAFGQLALRLTERFNAVDSRCRNLVLYALFGQSWNHPWRDLRASFQEAVRAGLESGDLLFTTYACGWIHLWAPDLDVKTSLEESSKYLAIIEKTDYQNARDVACLSRQFWTNLQGQSADPLSLSSEGFDEAACCARMASVRNISGLGIHALYKLKLCVLYGRGDEGIAIIKRSRPYIRALAGSPYMVEYCVYAFHACVAVASAPEHRTFARNTLHQLARQMRGWAAHAPENFRQHLLLMEAELARLGGDEAGATRFYEKAIAAARDGLFARYEALANESAARFFAQQGLAKVACLYLGEARYQYARWGATRKAKLLEDEYQRFSQWAGNGGSLLPVEIPSPAPPASQESHVSRMLDQDTVWSASQALSEEVILEKLLERLMTTLRQGAGATRVTLLLRDDDNDELFVQSDSREDLPTTVMQRQLPDQADLPLGVIRYVLRSGEPMVLADARREATLAHDPYLRGRDTRSMLAMPLAHRGRNLGVLYLENSLATHAFDPDKVATLRVLASQAAISLQNARLYDQVRRLAESFSRFVPREFLRSLGHSQAVDIRFGESVQKVMTVLFSDIRQFTTLVEKMSPTENIGFLNSYIAHMEPAILAHGGFIDSYAGDAIMALFDGPPARAVEAAVAMRRALYEFNAERASAGSAAVDMGIGLNTGLLTLGTIGGADRLKCGVIGDAVNVAARIEALTKRYHVKLLVSGETHRHLALPLRQATRLVDRVRVAGHAEPVTLHEVFEADDPAGREHKIASHARWHEALDGYFAGHFREALRLLNELRAAAPHLDDPVLQLYLERAQRFVAAPPAPGWTAIETLSEK